MARLGAGEVAHPKRPEQVGEKLGLMLGSDRYRHAAAAFARRYAGFFPKRQRRAMLGRALELLAAHPPHHAEPAPPGESRSVFSSAPLCA